ncbi:class I SAM-dependent methyltransferase [Macrococcus equipercicus]|nr:class I SAM-dependent methyltransferase [Macrococcus equipercicus]
MRNDFTLRLLQQAGISEGMHVLDVGCGHGEVTQVILELVGKSGSVTALI